MRVHCSINDRKGQTGYYDIFKLFPDAFRVRFFVFHGVILATNWPCLGEVKTLCENAHFADRGPKKSRCQPLRRLKWRGGCRAEPRDVCDAKPRNAFAFLDRAEVRAVSRDHPKTEKARSAVALSPENNYTTSSP